MKWSQLEWCKGKSCQSLLPRNCLLDTRAVSTSPLNCSTLFFQGRGRAAESRRAGWGAVCSSFPLRLTHFSVKQYARHFQFLFTIYCQGARKDHEFQSRLRVMDIDEACRQKAVETSDTLTSTPTKVYNIHAYVVLSGETKIHTKSTQIPGFHNTVSLILL